MIVVVADDLTGAAELAGIGLRYNLKGELFMSSLQTGELLADLFIACSDTRSMNKESAKSTSARIAKEVASVAPEILYKKIDSVFRGHVLDEVKIEMEELGLRRTLILGANPSLGRTICDGKYFINGEPISDTDFGTDPEFAITDSSVLRMLRAHANDAVILKHTDDLPEEGIVIAEAESTEDITAWASRVDGSWLLCGAGDFFTALLHRDRTPLYQNVSPPELPYLYVSGTAFGKARTFVKQIDQKLHYVSYLTPTMMETGRIEDETWFKRIGRILHEHNKAVMAINDEDVNPWNVSPLLLRSVMAKVVKKILELENIKELFIEGGSTAAAVLNELQIKKLSVSDELQRGVARMKSNEIYITVKPGSYELPAEIKQLFSH